MSSRCKVIYYGINDLLQCIYCLFIAALFIRDDKCREFLHVFMYVVIYCLCDVCALFGKSVPVGCHNIVYSQVSSLGIQHS